MPHIPGPPKSPPVEVIEVGEAPVPFLRPFDWVATTLRSFRERPLPSTYVTQAAPGFDLFGTSRLPEYDVEQISGGADNIEVFGAKIPAGKWRQYLSVSVSHNDPTPRIVTLTRIVQHDVLGFPPVPFAVSASLPRFIAFPERNISVPPAGRIGAQVAALTLGAELFLATLFIEYDVGEPSGDVS